MKSVIASLVAVAGMSVAAQAVDNTNVTFQVSLDGNNWGSVVDVSGAAATNVYARVLVSYIPGSNSATPIGLASMVFQPTVSNWNGGTDTLMPFINGGSGSNNSSPLGVLTGAQLTDTTSFGRVSPWGRSAISSTAFMKGHVHTNPTGDGLNYLRIAQAQVTSWIGGTGNSTGGSGILIGQLNDVGRTASDPAFNGSLTDVFVFKFGMTIGAGHTANLLVDAPIAGFGNRVSATSTTFPNSQVGDREVYWFASSSEGTGSLHGTAHVNTALIRVPAPGTAALLGLGGLAVARRRRQA